ncbi:hypothetical protein [Actinomadura sp. 7K507]|uniref:hypothetical protein n=1 Tax=Actinomadura sp. 7K507 TaxID=2530365 RepID=UPI001052A325|nr:hypothetical protein [Actinomadura sp. 7K507]TDC80972.1 hypothetical protein E1285_33795 [Actinomadura sp. 7K507]
MDRSDLLTPRKIGFALGCVALLVVLLAAVAPGLWTYATGTTTTAHVDRCESRTTAGQSSGRLWTCHGSWTEDGERRSGEIEGAGRTDEGKAIEVRANGSRASTARTPKTALLITGVFFGTVVLTLAWMTPRLLRSRSRKA